MPDYTDAQIKALPEFWDKVNAYRNMGLTDNVATLRALAYFRGSSARTRSLLIAHGIIPNPTAPQVAQANNADMTWFDIPQPAVQPEHVVNNDFVLNNGMTFGQAVEVLQQTVITNTASPRKAVKKEPVPIDGSAKMQELYSYPQMSLRKQESVAYEKTHQVEKPFEFVTNNGMVGIEIEVENITNGLAFPAYWSSHADGSLRNNGIEFVSVPLQIKQVQLALELLYKSMKETNKPSFSNRTSVHIHLNCRDLTQDQVYSLVLLYAIFEKQFYNIAGTKRTNSIYCVPLWRCNILRSAYDVIYRFSPKWHKYCGINLLPLVDNNGQRGYGTIEFRHLYGTDDVNSILEWINLIVCLRKAVMETSSKELIEEIKAMNTSSSYLALFSKVFPNIKPIIGNKEFEECISNIKRELFEQVYAETISKSSDSLYWKTVRQFGIRG